MTREEAIEQIKWYFEEDDGISAENITKEAIDMAIEALKADVARWSSWNKTFEQSGIADLISRADAIDALYRSSVYSWSVEQDQSAHTWALNIIAELPSADRPTGDLISREDAKKEVYVLGKNPPINEIWDCLDALPSADRPQGEWVDREVFNETDDDHIVEEWQSARCSVCGKYHTTPYMYYFDDFNYCPNCGAEMYVPVQEVKLTEEALEKMRRANDSIIQSNQQKMR